MKKILTAMILILYLAGGAALADTISFNGKVEASQTWLVYAPVSGTVASVPVLAGQKVTADTVIAKIKTNAVYAAQDGTVTAVYGQPGDEAENVTAAYGAVMYLEGETLYTVSATTARAYDDKSNYIVHSGEKVYLVSRNHTLDTGEGIITEVADSSYTVRVTIGNFYIGDSVDIFRSEDTAAASRIGRGTVARVAPTAVTGSGSIVSFAVQAGEQVKRGQLLFETVDGSFAGLEMTGTDILAGVDGTISSLNAEEGSSLNANSTVAVIYPRDAVRVTVEVPEADLKELAVGQKVKVELDWNQDDGISYEGTVEMISALGNSGEETTTYTMYVSFVPDENTRYGMTAVVTTIEEKNPEEEPEEDAESATETGEDAAEPAEETGEEETSGEGGWPENPFGDGKPENMPEGWTAPTDGERPSRPENGSWPSGGERPSRPGSGNSGTDASAEENGGEADTSADQ